MAWYTSFVIVRPDVDKVVEVFRCNDLQKAKYWLTYIGKPGDCLCKTPLHAKHSKKSDVAEYWSHKQGARDFGSKEDEWRKLVGLASGVSLLSGQEEQFVEAQVSV